MGENTERNRSYEVRWAMGLTEGRDGSGYAVTRRDISAYPPDHPKHVVIPAGTKCHVITSNAGFRGIVAYATFPDGTVVPDVSLGAFDAVPHRFVGRSRSTGEGGPRERRVELPSGSLVWAEEGSVTWAMAEHFGPRH